MREYNECKEIALKKAEYHKITIDTAYKIGDDYAFDNSREEVIGILPFVVDADTGECVSLWYYLNDKDLTMDDMQDIDF